MQRKRSSDSASARGGGVRKTDAEGTRRTAEPPSSSKRSDSSWMRPGQSRDGHSEEKRSEVSWGTAEDVNSEGRTSSRGSRRSSIGSGVGLDEEQEVKRKQAMVEEQMRALRKEREGLREMSAQMRSTRKAGAEGQQRYPEVAEPRRHMGPQGQAVPPPSAPHGAGGDAPVMHDIATPRTDEVKTGFDIGWCDLDYPDADVPWQQISDRDPKAFEAWCKERKAEGLGKYLDDLRSAEVRKNQERAEAAMRNAQAVLQTGVGAGLEVGEAELSAEGVSKLRESLEEMHRVAQIQKDHVLALEMAREDEKRLEQERRQRAKDKDERRRKRAEQDVEHQVDEVDQEAEFAKVAEEDARVEAAAQKLREEFEAKLKLLQDSRGKAGTKAGGGAPPSDDDDSSSDSSSSDSGETAEEFDVDDDGASYKSVGTAGSRRSRGPGKEESDARRSATGGQAGGSTSVGRLNAGTNTGVITGSYDKHFDRFRSSPRRIHRNKINHVLVKVVIHGISIVAAELQHAQTWSTRVPRARDHRKRKF